MKKRYLKLLSLITFTFAFVMTTCAASNKLEIVERSKTNPIGISGELFTKEIINENLETGTFDIKLTFNNTIRSEIVFVIDNSSEMASNKSTVITSLKNLAKDLLENQKNVKIGISSTTGELLKPTNSIDELNTALDNVASKDAETESDYLTTLKNYESNFSDENINRVAVLVAASNPNTSFDKTKISSLTSIETSDQKFNADGRENTSSNGNIDLIVITTKTLSENSDFKNLFSDTNYTSLLNNDSDDFATLIETNAKNSFSSTLPTTKTAVTVTDLIPSVILDNFTISNEKILVNATVGESKVEKTEKSVIWNIGALENDEIVELTYTVTVNEKIDEAIVDYTLDLNSTDNPVNISYGYASGTLPNVIGTFTGECNPKIKLLQVENPKTGIINYTISGIVLIVIAGSTFIIADKNKKFNTI